MLVFFLNDNWYNILFFFIKNIFYYNYFNYLKESLMRCSECLFYVRKVVKVNIRILKLFEV